MLDERLFYFIHGIATMYFILEGLRLLRSKTASRLGKLCANIMLYWSFLEIKDLAFYPASVFRENYISNILILIDITAVPACALFIIELLNSGWNTLRRAVLLTSPILVSICAYIITKEDWIIDLTYVVGGFYALLMLTYLVYAGRRYNRMLANNFSNTDFMNIRWLKHVAIILTICLIVWILSTLFSSWIVDSIYQLLLMTTWIVILHFTERQQTPQITPCLEQETIDDNVADNFPAHKLHELMTKEKVWLQPHLTLADLAAYIGTNRTYLSHYLNQTLNTSFYDYINQYRLEAALKRLEEPNSNATIVEIAESCGFNSLSTFRRVFTRAKGCTFAEYRQQKSIKRV